MRIPLASKVDMATPRNQPKLIHAGDEWLGQNHPHILVRDDAIRLIGSLKTGMTIDPDFGTMLQGKMSFSEAPDMISFSGGYWRFNPLLLAAFGSSAAMPIPLLVNSSPELLRDANDLRQVMTDAGA